MPEYLSPGVYIEEVASGARPIEGVGTAMAAFVGFAPAGPANTPMLITNWAQYVDTFGSLEEGGQRNPHLPGAYLSHSVYGYFLNGGGRCYVARVVPTAKGKDGDNKPAATQIPSRSAKGLPSISVTPKSTPSSDIQIEVAPPVGEEPAEGTFTLKIKMGGTEEVYENVSLARRGAKNVVETVNQTSRLVTVLEIPGAGSLAERTPGVGTYTVKAPEKSATAVALKTTHFVGDVAERSGIEGMEVADDVTMLVCPDLMSAFQSGSIDKDGVKAVQLAMIAHCERLGNRMAVLDPLPSLSPQEVKKWRERDTNYDSKFAAVVASLGSHRLTFSNS